MRSFVCQLLNRDVPWDLRFLSPSEFGKIEDGELDSVVKLFRNLIRQLPDPTFLFWIIDGVNYYERAERRGDFVKVMNELLGIMNECENVVIKLLLTCPGRSLYVKDALGKEDVLNVPLTVDGGRQGWSERRFQKAIGNDIEKLDGGERGGGQR